MKRYVQPLISLALAFSVTFTSCRTGGLDYSRSAEERGRLDALQDIRTGRLASETFGKPAFYREEYHRLLKKRFGIDYKIVAGCLVDDRIVGHAAGYNEVMHAEILARFGADVFERTAAEAQRSRP